MTTQFQFNNRFNNRLRTLLISVPVRFWLSVLFFTGACTDNSQTQTHAQSPSNQDSDDADNTTDDSSVSSDAHSDDSIDAESGYETHCDDYATTNIEGVGKLSNNVWGYESASFASYTQCVFYDTEAPNVFGWKWQLEGESEYPSYPRIGFGWNPWDRESAGTDALPRKINSLSSIVVSFEKKLKSDGLYNTAFDIWLTSPDDEAADVIVGEIMIWLDATKSQSANLTDENIKIGEETYDFYKNTSWNDFPYLAFVQENDHWTGQIDLMKFVSYLVEHDHLEDDAHIAEIEFGNEIWSGSGEMIVRDFSFSIE